MTIPVGVDQLAKVLGRFGPGYLLTLKPPQADGPAVKVHCVDPVFDDGRLLVVCEHRSALDNAGQDPRVTIVWPPLAHHGHSLIVDGSATVHHDRLVVDIVGAILHRPDAHSDGPDWVFGD
jgi:hypothetical protein